jgi:hypothetical protein
VAKADPVKYVPFVPRVQEPVVVQEPALVQEPVVFPEIPPHHEPAALVRYDHPFSLAQDTPTHGEEQGLVRFDRIEPAARDAQPPLEFVPRTERRRPVAVDSPSDVPVPVDPMDAILKALDKAMVEIPTLRGE